MAEFAGELDLWCKPVNRKRMTMYPFNRSLCGRENISSDFILNFLVKGSGVWFDFS